MFLEIGTILPDFNCPICNIGLYIKISYEDNRYNINDTRLCPKCNIPIHIDKIDNVIKEIYIDHSYISRGF